MLNRIEMSDVMRRATEAFDAHNDACPTAEHIRKNKNQTETVVTRRIGIIPEAITTTFHTILSEYVYSYNNQIKISPFDTYNENHLPALRTNCVRLGNRCRATDRTVRNHIDRLRDLDFISTEFHGSKKSFELWISPKFLFGTAKIENSETAKNAPEIALSGNNPKNFPHICTYRETSEKEKGNADMLNSQHGFILNGENIQGQRGEADNSPQGVVDPLFKQREEIPGGGENLSREQIAALDHQKRQEKNNQWLESRKPKMPSGLKGRQLEMLVEFWLYAWKIIYPGREFNKQQQEKALIAISAGVYNDFTDERTDAQWIDFQVHQLSKVDKAGRFYDNRPHAYKPDPYAVHIPGRGYFDNINENGFIGIEGWIKKDSVRLEKNRSAYATQKELAKRNRCEKLLRTARCDFENLRAGNKLRIEVQYMNQIALFKFYNTVFAGMGQEWQERFCNQYLVQQNNDFARPQYMKSRIQQESARRKQATTVSAAAVQIVEHLQDYNYDGYGYDVD